LVVSPSLEDILHYDQWARQYAAGLQKALSVWIPYYSCVQLLMYFLGVHQFIDCIKCKG
jgi:hypothetical protein